MLKKSDLEPYERICKQCDGLGYIARLVNGFVNADIVCDGSGKMPWTQTIKGSK